METQLFAPEIDNIIDNIKWEPAPINTDIYQKLKNVYSVFSCVKTIGDDELRETWLEVERGPVEAFGSFEEFEEGGEVENRNDFEQLWKDYYPEETKWYKFQAAKYEDNLYFYFGGKLLWSVNEPEFQEEDEKSGWNLEYFEKFAGWLLEKITDETNKLRGGVNAYNSYIHQNLSWTKRLGKIRRKEFWEIMGDETIRLDIKLGQELIEKLKMAVNHTKENQFSMLPKMTANLFFRVCEIGYDGNGYFSE